MDCLNLIDGIPVVTEESKELYPSWNIDNSERCETELRRWWNVPFVSGNEVWCLNGGAWDRPLMVSATDSEDEAIKAAIKLVESKEVYRRFTCAYRREVYSMYVQAGGVTFDRKGNMVRLTPADMLEMFFGWLPAEQ